MSQQCPSEKSLPVLPSIKRRAARLALAGVGLSSAAGLFLALPSRAQQPQPSLTPSVPLTRAAGRTTPVSVDFSIPAGYRFLHNPRVRVIDAKDQIVELRHLYITRHGPSWQASRGLDTAFYRPGAYRVRFEATYELPNGSTGSAITPWSPLTVNPQ